MLFRSSWVSSTPRPTVRKDQEATVALGTAVATPMQAHVDRLYALVANARARDQLHEALTIGSNTSTGQRQDRWDTNMTTAPGKLLHRLDSNWLSALCMTAIDVYDTKDIVPADDDMMIAVEIEDSLSSSHNTRISPDAMIFAKEIDIENNSDSSNVDLINNAMEIDIINTRLDLDELDTFLEYDKAIVDK